MQLLILGKESVTINGKTIPKLFGGFSSSQAAILAKQIAEIHDCEVKQINRIVGNNLDWFDEMIDYIDLKSIISIDYPGVLSKHPSETIENSEVSAKEVSKFLIESGFYPNSQAIGGTQHIYLFSQQGYAMLCKFMKSGIAKQIYKQMVREYFRMVEIQIRPTFEILCREQKAVLEIAQNYGLQGNQATLFANRLIKERYGVNLLEIGGQPALITEIQDVHLTPTAIGKILGISPQKTNELLKKAGLQESFRDAKNKKCWKPKEKGKEFSVLKDTNKKHTHGCPVQQLMWRETVVDILKKFNESKKQQTLF